jgi:hypothetical protein
LFQGKVVLVARQQISSLVSLLIHLMPSSEIYSNFLKQKKEEIKMAGVMKEKEEKLIL